MNKQKISDLVNKIDEVVTFEGWIDSARDHGNLAFLDVRDRSGIVQVVVWDKNLIPIASSYGSEDLIRISGKVQKRPEKLINSNIPTGSIEVGSTSLKLISKSETLPFEINTDTSAISELNRFEYRYLDLRSARMQNNLKMRSKINHFFRSYLEKNGFWEIETPSLTKGTPEGAREFIVPSRTQPGKFFVLPQSPQQFKQLLMVSGIEKYYQIAKCFRDEDQRGDRQPEFTQLDIEASFIDQAELLGFLEKMIISLVKELFPEKKLKQTPFPRMTYQEVMSKYKSDKPDLRETDDPDELAFLWVVDFPMFDYSETEKKIVANHHPFTRPLDEDLPLLDTEPKKARANAYDLVLNGSEIGGGSIRIHERELQEQIFKILALSDKEIQSRFGHMLKAFKFGAPPHGGFAFGLDRLITILLNQKSIREVIAFPKTGDAKDPLMGAPDAVSKDILDEVHIEVKKPKK